MNNIFSYSPKELTTDAFLAWLFVEFNENEKLKKYAPIFFYQLGLCDNDNDCIANIKISKQEKNTDLIIRCDINDVAHQALFENKTYTTAHSKQLEKYKEKFPNFNHYKYLKLGFISYAESAKSRSVGYDVIDVYKLHLAIKSIGYENYLIEHYKEFLKVQYINPFDAIKNGLIKNNEYERFEEGQAQQFFLSKLHESIDGLNDDLDFKFAANSGGTPWTELDIAKRDNAYGEESEYLFWRIDQRSKGYYLRLNQYSSIGNEFWPKKAENLKLLRNIITPLFEKQGLSLGKTSNRGRKESEVAILFFKDNKLSDISHVLPELSREIYRVYSSIGNWA